jgi:hypothetical protein
MHPGALDHRVIYITPAPLSPHLLSRFFFFPFLFFLSSFFLTASSTQKQKKEKKTIYTWIKKDESGLYPFDSDPNLFQVTWSWIRGVGEVVGRWLGVMCESGAGFSMVHDGDWCCWLFGYSQCVCRFSELGLLRFWNGSVNLWFFDEIVVFGLCVLCDFCRLRNWFLWVNCFLLQVTRWICLLLGEFLCDWELAPLILISSFSLKESLDSQIGNLVYETWMVITQY